MYCVTALEAGSLRPGFLQGWLLLRAARMCSVPLSWLLVVPAIFGVPWLIDVSPRSLPLSSHDTLSACVCLCVPISPFYKDISHIGVEPTLMISF